VIADRLGAALLLQVPPQCPVEP